MKKIFLLGLLSLLLAVNVSAKKEEVSSVSGNFSLSNDYIWRGKAQHKDFNGDHQAIPTISGGFDYDTGIGFTIGAWGSNVSLNSGTNTINSTSTELDLYINYANEINRIGLGYEIGYIDYTYPNSTEGTNDFKEAYLALSMKGFTLTGSSGISTDAQANIELSYTKEIADKTALTFTAGKYGFNNKEEDKENANDYRSLTFNTTVNNIDYTLSAIKNIQKNDAKDSQSYLVFSIGRSF